MWWAPWNQVQAPVSSIPFRGERHSHLPQWNIICKQQQLWFCLCRNERSRLASLSSLSVSHQYGKYTAFANKKWHETKKQITWWIVPLWYRLTDDNNTSCWFEQLTCCTDDFTQSTPYHLWEKKIQYPVSKGKHGNYQELKNLNQKKHIPTIFCDTTVRCMLHRKGKQVPHKTREKL